MLVWRTTHSVLQYVCIFLILFWTSLITLEYNDKCCTEITGSHFLALFAYKRLFRRLKHLAGAFVANFKVKNRESVQSSLHRQNLINTSLAYLWNPFFHHLNQASVNEGRMYSDLPLHTTSNSSGLWWDQTVNRKDHIIHKLIVLQNNFHRRWVLYATEACPEFHSMKKIDWSTVLLCTPSGGCPTKHITVIIIHNTNYEKSDWSKAHSQHTIACEADMKTQYLQQIVGSHVKFKICLVSKPWSMHYSQTFANSERCLLLQIV